MMSETLRLVCTNCQTINQLNSSRLGDSPRCAKCKQALLDAAPVAVDAQALQRQITHSGIPVLVDFWAPWCGPCQQFAPVFAQFAAAQPGIRCVKLNTETEPAAGTAYQIRSIPTLALFQGGRELARISGALPPSQLSQWVRQQLG